MREEGRKKKIGEKQRMAVQLSTFYRLGTITAKLPEFFFQIVETVVSVMP